ncbi:MAG: hypothetical protein WKF78_12745 [Candidatus Limnocylindrales bacterium]
MPSTPPRRLVILTEGQFGVHDAKTAMGVIRYGRDDVRAILDSTMAGRNLLEFLPGSRHPVRRHAPGGARTPAAPGRAADRDRADRRPAA